jgi:hypothetical protein
MIQHYIINHPIGRLGNHLITYINTIYLHYLLDKKSQNNTFKITLNGNHDLLKNTIIFGNDDDDDNDNDDYNDNDKNENNDTISRLENTNIIPGYNIFHIQEILNNKLKAKYNICIYDYFYLAALYLPKLWKPEIQLDKFKSIFTGIIQDNYINLDKTLCIHIKCTDNTIPERIIHKKYNIYPNIYYLDICKVYNYDTICICTDNPDHILIKNLIEKGEKQGITVINISKLIQKIIPKKTHYNLTREQMMMMDFYFLSSSRNIMVDNSTFTFISALHPTFISDDFYYKNKTIFFYRDFFSRFLLDIGTNEWDKNILDFCINNLDSFDNYNNYTNYNKTFSEILIYNEIELCNYPQSRFCNCVSNCVSNCISQFNENISGKDINNHKLVLFDVNTNTNNIKIKIGDWKGNKEQIQMLLIQ